MCVRRGRGVRWVGVIVEVCTEHVNVRTMKHIPRFMCKVDWEEVDVAEVQRG